MSVPKPGKCRGCKEAFPSRRARGHHESKCSEYKTWWKKKKHVPPTKAAEAEVLERDDPQVKPDWGTKCEVCNAVPTLPLTGMCGPCTWGEAETAGGNW